jgi:excinuclease ABC subunit B
LGSPKDYKAMLVTIQRGDEIDRDTMLAQLVDIQYNRNEMEKAPGTFRVRGDSVDVFPSYNEEGIRISMFGDEVEAIQRIDPLTGNVLEEIDEVHITPAKHFVTPYSKVEAALEPIREEMEARVARFEQENKLLEAQRLRMRTEYDLEMLKELGFCSGIENYSRFLTGRSVGDRPYTLIDFFEDDFLTIVDESHVTLPQVRGMYNGDRARKTTLVEHGFRLPSALDNRPLNFEEFLEVTGPMVFVSATPSQFEKDKSGEPVRQVIRPTGIIDPEVIIRPLKGQIDDLMEEVRARAEKSERVLVTTLTKKTSEDLAEYLQGVGLSVKYLHSDIDAVERVEILRALRAKEFDCLIGINLLREGLDLPEVSLVAILDADKEGFLRSETSLIQTAGRAARNIEGKVILYADKVTDSMQALLTVTEERRIKQLAYNKEHGITPKSVIKSIQESLSNKEKADEVNHAVVREGGGDYDVNQALQELEEEMLEAARSLEFERAAMIRDQIGELRAVFNLDSGKKGKKAGGKTTYPTRKGGKGKKRNFAR